MCFMELMTDQVQLVIEEASPTLLTLYHTIPTFNTPVKEVFRKHSGIRAANCRKIRPSYPKL